MPLSQAEVQTCLSNAVKEWSGVTIGDWRGAGRGTIIANLTFKYPVAPAEIDEMLASHSLRGEIIELDAGNGVIVTMRIKEDDPI
jgi:hypothetical protein